MKKIITLILVTIITISCSSNLKKKDGNMIVKGQIKDLKKGTLYLQRMKDTVLISVDSISLFGDDHFILADHIDSPQMYYLTFDGNTTQKRIMFFGEKGNITINDNVEKFGLFPEVSGSKNHEVLQKFFAIDKKFKNQRLDFIKKDFDARKAKDTKKIAELEIEYKKMMRRRFLFTANFAISNADFEAAPYIALTELYDATITILDTVNNSLSEKVKNSEYGKRFNKYVTDIKKKEGK